jgi:ribosomal protein L11
LGLGQLGVDVGDVIDAHIQVNDVHGVVAAILGRARNVGVRVF